MKMLGRIGNCGAWYGACGEDYSSVVGSAKEISWSFPCCVVVLANSLGTSRGVPWGLPWYALGFTARLVVAVVPLLAMVNVKGCHGMPRALPWALPEVAMASHGNAAAYHGDSRGTTTKKIQRIYIRGSVEVYEWR